MPLRVWRLCRKKYAARAFDGTGARLYGGRWNPPGVAVVYTCASLSLAALELFVHVDPEDAPVDLVAIPVDIPDGVTRREVRMGQLPKNWRRTPAPRALRQLGGRWARGLTSAVLLVPSVVVPQERDCILKPAHPDFRRLAIGKPQRFEFDPRMWK